MPYLADRYLPLSEFEGYQVGTDGSIWSCWKRKSYGRGGMVARVMSSKWFRMKPIKTKKGYFVVTLMGKYQRRIHKLVLTTFVGPCPQGMECRHLDGDKSNNNLSNLCWGTALENYEDRVRHGTSTEGSKNYNAKFTEEDIRTMRWLRANGWPLGKLAAKYHISKPRVCDICAGRAWSHVK